MYTAFLAIRYLLRRRVSALAALLAVTFGVASFFTVVSVMEGYRVKVRELVRGLESHLTLKDVRGLPLGQVEEIEGAVRSVPRVAATAAFVETVAMYRSFGRFGYFQALKGIDPFAEARVGDLEVHLLRPGPAELGRIFPDAETPQPRAVLEERVQSVLTPGRPPLDDEEIERLFSRALRIEVHNRANPHDPIDPADEKRSVPPGIVVGLNLLLDREVILGDELKVIALSPRSGKPVLASLLVVGAFKSGDYEADSRTALVSADALRNLLDLFDPETGGPQSDGIRIALRDYREAAEARSAILRALAEAAVGRKIPAVVELAREAAAGTYARAGALAEELAQELKREQEQRAPEAPLPADEELRAAVERAAALLDSAGTLALVERRVRQAYEAGLESGIARFRAVHDEGLLWTCLQAADDAWREVLGMPAPPAAAGRPSPLSPLDEVARLVVLHDGNSTMKARAGAMLAAPLAVEVLTWEDRQEVLLQAVKREKRIVSFLVLLINGFVACMVLLMLLLLVIEKTRDLGILLALGATPRGVVGIFLATGLVLTTLGVLLGLLGGYYFVRNINVVHDAIYAATGVRLFDPETYKMDRLPITVSAAEVLTSILPAVSFGLAASLVPAVWASRQDPIKAIHYE